MTGKRAIERMQHGSQTFIFINKYTIVAVGENNMGDKIEMTGNIRNSIVNVKTNQNGIDQSINQFSKTNLLFYELQNLNLQLEKALRPVPVGNEEEAEAVLEYARRLLGEAAKSKPNKTLIKISGEGLLAAAKNIVAITPAVLTIATQIIETITKCTPQP
jgi:hypothetical protein